MAAVAAACGSTQAATPSTSPTVKVSLTQVDGVHCTHTPAVSHGALPTLPAPAAAALHQFGDVEATGRGLPATSSSTAGHLAVAAPADPTMSRADAHELHTQLVEAARAACNLLDTESVERAGYYIGSSNVEGVGTHWINWSLMNKPFDPARPSMLLFSTQGAQSHLVGFSYWVRSTAPPAGFAGGLDAWHRHFGVCFDANGMWSGEDETASECQGTYVNGRDLWMLHAWVVPGTDNLDGIFAPINHSQCHHNVPDIAKCPTQHSVG
jgi:hypothetical protein